MFLVAAPNRLTNMQSFVMKKYFAKKKGKKLTLKSHYGVALSTLQLYNDYGLVQF